MAFAAQRAALQVRWMSSVLVVDGRACPVEALMVDCVETEAADAGKTLICWSFIALTGWSFAGSDRSTAAMLAQCRPGPAPLDG
jgi:hypothetical protein